MTREAMRAAITNAGRAIEDAKAAGLNPTECVRLLTEAISASYRMDYLRSRNLARKAEAVALSLLERLARERERDGGEMEDTDEEE